jgi:hypothetical protein
MQNHTQYHTYKGKIEIIFSKVRSETMVFTLLLLLKTVLEFLGRAIKQETEIKGFK